MEPLTIFLILLSLCFSILYYFHQTLNVFKRAGIVHVKPAPIFGNMAPIIFRQKSMVEMVQSVYNLCPESKYAGFYDFANPVILVRDPELITLIAVRNFDSFCDHRGFIDEVTDPLIGKNLFALRGQAWRQMRRLLSPAFSSAKMKTMYELVYRCAENFVDYLADEAEAEEATNMKDAFARYANDVIASCAFGLTVDSMRYPNNEFFVLGGEATNLDGILSTKFFLGKNFPWLTKLLGLRMVSKRAADFFQDAIDTAIKTREEKGITRPDMIQLMMESRDKNDLSKYLSIEDMTSQAFVFFFAGFDTSSTFLSFAVHELAVNPDIQEKLRAEITMVAKDHDGKPSYEALKKMEYMEAVVNETLRLYPQAPFLDRVCVKKFQLPPALPGGKPFTITPGMTVWFSSFSLHRDPKYFPEPTKFRPSRFLEGAVNSSVYMPFGVGPRMCIGNRFALMEVKVVLFNLIRCCVLEPCSRTEIPLKFNKKSFAMMAHGGFWIKLRKIQQPSENSSCNSPI
ncbi:cytochrome P450 9e2-like [Prorops nasuta]|uniref:cytochrome P450 9e2-like n=1 Tax=Prorops nasuta TaxID=863751 RepID=UPI0034CEFF6E